jgi:VIT1/CCC1 family predicted Fe2+/Mn2+ transporter
MRGLVCGVMTTVGGLGHTLPYAIPSAWPNAFGIATALAIVVVVVELLAIAAIRTRYMATPFWRAALQVVLGGALVLLAGIAIGSA